MHLDLASFQSTKDFTVAFKEKNLPLHLLINNAGLAWSPYSEFDRCVGRIVSFETITLVLIYDLQPGQSMVTNFSAR